ncbi:MAG: 2-oxoacid:acceptor oxidoreductase subunit alpha [Chrysiogenetes bacterium]|nr:2-oxoacid:acceptor oxidoreductase subunit alpha [Chrysiogenetes bacterium]
MQLTGTQFTNTTAVFGNDFATLPDYPAEIRAPAGTLAGVSSFQVNFGDERIYTPGDQPDVLVAMNPAALKVHLHDLRDNGVLIVNEDAFTEGNLSKAGFKSNPLEDGSIKGYQLFSIPITKMTLEALKDSPLKNKDRERCKNFYALGVLLWLYHRPLTVTTEWIETKFKKKPDLVEANITALKTGYHFGETTEMFQVSYEIAPTKRKPGTYRNITGNEALARGLAAASKITGRPLFLGSYPITPASDILHELSTFKNFRVHTFQAEDEIAGACSAIGASFAGALAVTTTSGPGIALKGEALGLAVMTELPLVIINVQRGGPSTGLPTKTEQSDLNQALYGRHGESPMCVLAARSPGDCFYMGIEAFRIATKYMCPVLLLTDGYLANGAEPWRIPEASEIPKFEVKMAQPELAEGGFLPYKRDPNTLARPWAIPGTPALEHRIGGLEKAADTGNVSYDPANHEAMVRTRQAKVEKIVQEIPPLEITGEKSGKLLVVGWGGTYGSIQAGVRRAQQKGLSVSSVHIQHLNPLPPDLGEIMGRFEKILVPELNLGQLRNLLRATYLVDAQGLNKIKGLPFRAVEILEKIEEMLG